MKTQKTTKKQGASMFGINDCHRPKNNTRKRRLSSKPVVLSKKTYNYPTVILFPHSLGQTKHGTEKAPAFLANYINRNKHEIKKVNTGNSLFKNIKLLYEANKKTSGKIVNIGGDHSMSIATIADTMNKHPDAKVIYFDSHADINTYKSSNSKHYHGMPLSFVTGLDKDPKFNFIKNKLPFENLLYIGSRCWDIFEVDEVYKQKIQFITPAEINNNFNVSLNKIMNFVGDSPVHVSFDVDSIDPKYIPSTGTPVKNGVELDKAIKLLDNLNNSNIVNLDITELNMNLGSKKDGILSGKNTERLFRKFLN
jgi:arginase